MKKLSIASVIILALLTSCNTSPNANGSDGGHGNGGTSQGSSLEPYVFDLDLTGCVANIQDASSLRIAKKNSAPRVGKRRDEPENATYLYKSGTDIEEMIEVSFTKYSSTTVSTPVEGEISYIANNRDDDGFISIHAEESFVYAVYDSNDQEIASNVTDNSELDNDERDGIIEITNLTPYEEYVVKYSGYREVETITQEELEAEIDKLFVFSSQFTFVSFVPKGGSMRPSDEYMEYGKDGISKYDKTDYLDEEFRKSFVFDNFSGFIYSLEDANVTSIDDNLVFSNGEYCDIYTNEDGNLTIVPICKNKTLTVSYAFKDKHGNKYILNDKLETYDANSNSYYYVTGPDMSTVSSNISVNFVNRYIYVRTSTNEAIRFPSCFAAGGDLMQRSESKTIDLMLENGETRLLNENDSFELLPFYMKEGTTLPQRVVNGYVYIETGREDILKTNRFVEPYGDYGMFYLNNDNGEFKSYHLAAHAMRAVNFYYVNNYDVMLVVDGNGGLYSFQNCLEYLLFMESIGCVESQYGEVMLWAGNPYMELEVDDKYVKQLATGVVIDPDNQKIIEYGVDGNIYYDVYVGGSAENPSIGIYETGTYTPEEPEVTAIVIQPINR